MEAVLAVFAGIDDPRDHTAQYELPALLFMALAATLCGARSCVDIADFAAANRADLADIVDLPASTTPSHDTFSRLFRLLDPEQLQASATPLRRRPARGSRPAAGRGHSRSGWQAPAPRLRTRPGPHASPDGWDMGC